ncbi:Uncharacterised protein [Corynebacterium pseudotuberculosis]|nr:hypothetical protein C8E98_1141 [Corynebacterium pseudotuberculosis]VTQ70620.1 Uncharacterised protein [Corynebacterium pseudotuberculosis]
MPGKEAPIGKRRGEGNIKINCSKRKTPLTWGSFLIGYRGTAQTTRVLNSNRVSRGIFLRIGPSQSEQTEHAYCLRSLDS